MTDLTLRAEHLAFMPGVAELVMVERSSGEEWRVGRIVARLDGRVGLSPVKYHQVATSPECPEEAPSMVEAAKLLVDYFFDCADSYARWLKSWLATPPTDLKLVQQDGYYRVTLQNVCIGEISPTESGWLVSPRALGVWGKRAHCPNMARSHEEASRTLLTFYLGSAQTKLDELTALLSAERPRLMPTEPRLTRAMFAGQEVSL